MTTPVITTADIEKLATLARIKISDEEKVSMQKDIESILEYVGQIVNVSADQANEVPTLRNVMRDDVVTHSTGEYTETLLTAAPAREGNYLKVKKILG